MFYLEKRCLRKDLVEIYKKVGVWLEWILGRGFQSRRGLTLDLAGIKIRGKENTRT